MTIAPGTKLGRYEIRSQLGKGGMGEVYLAQDTRLDRRVALKILPAEATLDPKRMQRFTQEAKAASALNHPNILTIYEIEEIDSIHFIATEFIDGGTLRERMHRNPLKLSEVLDIGLQSASALSAAHLAGIVHRDVKPENIMLRHDGIVKVLDFGLAKLNEPSDGQLQPFDTQAPTRQLINTEPGVVMGTITYMSPEQARGAPLDARTDIFNLGILIYEMTTGCLPFDGSNTNEILSSILSDKEPPPMARFSREVPSELERIVSKALRKDRDQRYQTIKDLWLDLQSLKEQLEFEIKLERSKAPISKKSINAEVGPASAAETISIDAAQPTSSRSQSVSAIRKHRLGLLAAATSLVLVILATLAYFGAFSPRSNSPITSLAVMPLTNDSNNPDTEYFSDGITESLINRLSQLPGVKVIASVSSFKYKGREVEPQEVGRALGVEAILTGRVLQRGEYLSISVQLVDARDRTQLWGEQYQRKASDVLAVQSEISGEIAEALRLRLTGSVQQQLSHRETVNPQAYELLLMGRFYSNKVGTDNRKKAAEYFEKAIAIDPNYALAHAELSLIYTNLVGFSGFDPREFMPKAERAARKAVELDPKLPEAPYALATIERFSWQWSLAEQHYKRSVELNPNLSRAHNGYALFLAFLKKHDEAVVEIKRARELDPLSPLINLNLGVILYVARRYDEAIETFRRTLELDPKNGFVHVQLGSVYSAKAMYSEAIAAYEEAVQLGEGTPRTQIRLGATLARAGERRKAQDILKELQSSGKYVSPVDLAVLYVALGEQEQAIAALEKAYDAHDLQLQYLAADPALDPLRSDQRFAALVRRVGLPE